MSNAPSLPSPEYAPVPPQHLRWYGRFWDIMSIAIFSMGAVVVLASNWGALDWRHWTAAALTLIQGALYVWSIALRSWPISRRWLALYFGGGITLWVITGFLEPMLWWLGMTYFGQMFGLLPPRVVIPGTFILNVLIILNMWEWDLSQAPPSLYVGFSFQWLGGMAVYLFINSIIRTSQERGGLITRLEAAQRQLEAAREKDVELAALRERERLARDLHDNLGHALVAMTVQLEAIQRLYRVDPERGSAQLDALKALTRQSMADLRRSLDGLRAPGLGEQKLSEALQTLCVQAGRRAALEIACQAPPEADGFNPAVQETLWRVAQEALTNIEKHARARRVTVRLEAQPAAAVLVIRDDGVGLPSEAELRPGHYGLRGMRERVEGLGGALTVAAGAEGTVVEARVPVVRALPAAQ